MVHMPSLENWEWGLKIFDGAPTLTTHVGHPLHTHITNKHRKQTLHGYTTHVFTIMACGMCECIIQTHTNHDLWQLHIWQGHSWHLVGDIFLPVCESIYLSNNILCFFANFLNDPHNFLYRVHVHVPTFNIQNSAQFLVSLFKLMHTWSVSVSVPNIVAMSLSLCGRCTTYVHWMKWRDRDGWLPSHSPRPKPSRTSNQVSTCTWLIIHEMLRKKGKATQHNSPKAVIFQRKN